MTPSDAFWDNAAAMITAAGVILIAILSPIITYILTKKRIKEEVSVVSTKLNEVGESVNGSLTKLLQAKDDLALSKEADQKLIDAKQAAHDSGKLEALQEQKKDDALKNTNPEK